MNTSRLLPGLNREHCRSLRSSYKAQCSEVITPRAPRQHQSFTFAAVVGCEICGANAQQKNQTTKPNQQTKKGDSDETSKSRTPKTGTTHRPWRCLLM